MIEAIRHQLGHLFDFSGRDGRGRFLWWYLIVFLAQLMLLVVLTVGIMGDAMIDGIALARDGDEAAMDAAMLAAIAERSGQLTVTSVAIGVASVLLMAGATVRRLHDIGRSGVWGVAIAIVYAVWIFLANQQSNRAASILQEDGVGSARLADAMSSGTGTADLLSYLPLIALLVVGILKSQPSTNKWGEPPVA